MDTRTSKADGQTDVEVIYIILTFQYCDTPSNNDIVTDVFHDSGSFTSNESQKNGCAIKIPKEK